jgi:ribosomal-protein-alanine N-acetyltransferase
VTLRLSTARAAIRCALHTDAAALLRYRCDNRAHLAAWEPQRDASWYTLEQCLRNILDGRLAMQQDRGYPLLVFAPDEREIIGTFTFANLVRGAFQSCHLGYGMAAAWQGQGLMQEVLEAGLAWAFSDLGMHRVMANYLPRNVRSAKLLQRLGFEREGYARQYLKIAGVWEDHVLTARIRPDD